jgi:hypothetical protein
MDDRGTYIDIVFRNGLKDMEVLPPGEVWENIRPVIRRKQRSFYLIRAAAIVSIFLALSFLSYRLSREISSSYGNQLLSFNQDIMPEGKYVPMIDETPFTVKKASVTSNTRRELIADNIKKSRLPDYGSLNPFGITSSAESNSLSTRNKNRNPAPEIFFVNSIQHKDFKVNNNEENLLLSKPDEIKLKRWAISAMASPAYFMKYDSKKTEAAKQLMASEHSLISYSGGFSFSYKINKKISIQSGIYYSSIGQEVSGINSYLGFQKYVDTKTARNFEVQTSSGTIFSDNIDIYLSDGSGERVSTVYTIGVFDPDKSDLQYLNNSVLQNFRYLEMPIMLRYKIFDKKIDLNFIGGISYNLLVNNHVYTLDNGKKLQVGKTDGLNAYAFSSSLGMGMEYNLSERLSLNLEPTIRYYLSPFSNGLGTNIHPYSVGVFSGLSYKF